MVSACPNAVLFPMAQCTWLDDRNWFSPDNRRYTPAKQGYVPRGPEGKEYALFFLTSDKSWAPGHQVRQRILESLCDVGGLKVWKHRSPPKIKDKNDTLDGYQFGVAVENERQPGWFTEKLIDHFVAKTVPLYWGAPDIGDFFNMDGVICFDDADDLRRKLGALTPDTYGVMRPAVEDNYRRAMEWVPIWQRLEDEITAGIKRKKDL